MKSNTKDYFPRGDYTFEIGISIITALGCVAFIAAEVIKSKDNTSFEYAVDEYGSYIVDENGNLEVTGKIKLSFLNKCYLIERKDEEGKLGLCIINKDGFDILTLKFVTEVHEVEGCLLSLDDNIYSVKKMSSYLDGYDDYLFSPEEISEMILAISQDYEWHEYKILSYFPEN